MGLLPIPAPKLTQGASRAGFWRAAALYDKRLPPPSLKQNTECTITCSPSPPTSMPEICPKGPPGHTCPKAIGEQSIHHALKYLETTCKAMFNLHARPAVQAKPKLRTTQN